MLRTGGALRTYSPTVLRATSNKAGMWKAALLWACLAMAAPAAAMEGEVSHDGRINTNIPAIVRLRAGDFGQNSIAETVKQAIDTEPVLMYSFTTCPFCLKAKDLLDSLGAKYEVVELNTIAEGGDIRNELKNLVGRTSVPAVFINGEFAGTSRGSHGVISGEPPRRTATPIRVGATRGQGSDPLAPLSSLSLSLRPQVAATTEASAAS